MFVIPIGARLLTSTYRRLMKTEEETGRGEMPGVRNTAPAKHSDAGVGGRFYFPYDPVRIP
ncbi:hypothetical protein JCM10550A_23790 [Methanogenium cariaci]